MRKISFLFAFFLSVMGVTQAWASFEETFDYGLSNGDDAVPQDEYTATFTNNLGWEHVYAYAWKGDGETAVKLLGDYPGKEVTQKEGNVYTLSFQASVPPEKIIFSESADGEKTLDLAFVNGGTYQTPGRKTIYLKPNSNWLQDNARFAMYMFNSTLNINKWNNFVAVEGQEGIYSSTVLDYYTGIVLCRMNPGTTVNNFDEGVRWNQTENITEFKDKDLYTINEDANNWKEYTKGTLTLVLALSEADTENKVVAGTYDKVNIARTVLAGPNPMCLPFAVSKADFERVFGAEATVLEFTGYDNGDINLTKKEIGDVAMEANVPYIVYAKQAATEISFYNVDVNSNAAGTVTNGEAQLIGTFVKKALYADVDKKPYAVSKTGTINPVKAGANLKGFRAYFMLPANSPAKVFIDGVAVDGEATGIEAIENVEAGELYDLSGRRVMNAQKGLYIQNGKKFVVK